MGLTVGNGNLGLARKRVAEHNVPPLAPAQGARPNGTGSALGAPGSPLAATSFERTVSANRTAVKASKKVSTATGNVS